MNAELDRIVKIAVLTVKALQAVGVTGVKPGQLSESSAASSGSGNQSEGSPKGGPSTAISGRDDHPYPMDPNMIQARISTREVSLTHEDAEKCFGQGYTFTIDSDLSGDGVTVYKEIVSVSGPDGAAAAHLIDVEAAKSSVRLLACDRGLLGIEAPLRRIDDLAESPSITVAGPCGEAELNEGAIVAQRYVTVRPEDAEKLGIRKNQLVNVRCAGSRGGLFSNTAVLIDAKAEHPVFHLDAEEADAMMMKSGQYVQIES
ncbi:MAG: PduL/EutD family phosphate acyltransferase [Eubacteriales bacterium]|nr:PduL/EutD family phosphate acyltransferase [Eubacteriales bacterium]